MANSSSENSTALKFLYRIFNNLNHEMLFVYLMDKFVWMLLATVFTTLALEMTGAVGTREVHVDYSQSHVDPFHFETDPEKYFYEYPEHHSEERTSNIEKEETNISEVMPTPLQKQRQPAKSTSWVLSMADPIPLDSITKGITLPSGSPDTWVSPPTINYKYNQRLRRDIKIIVASI